MDITRCLHLQAWKIYKKYNEGSNVQHPHLYGFLLDPINLGYFIGEMKCGWIRSDFCVSE